MGAVINLWDRLTNIMSGKGTTADRRVWERYSFIPVDPVEAEAAYRSSWLWRKIVDVPALDMTRAWRNWMTEKEAIQKLEAEERRLQLKDKCKRALILSRLFGGGALLLGTGDTDVAQPLNPASVKKGGLSYVHVFSRHQLMLGEMRLDPADPWFGKPEYFTIKVDPSKQAVRIHPSRIVEFVGQRCPEGSWMGGTQLGGSWFWGDPIMQSIGQAIRNADLAQDGFAGLIDKASVDILKIPNLMAQAGDPAFGNRLMTRLAAAQQGMSNHRALAIDAEEDWHQLTVNWGGIPQVVDSYLLIVAGAADIPMTRLLGQSPKGLQSTGDGEERDYQAMILARQDEQLVPALDRVDELLLPSALGNAPSDIYYELAPLTEASEKDSADIELKLAQAWDVYATSGEFPSVALAEMAKNRLIECGRWPGVEKAFEDAANEPTANEANQQNEGDLQTMQQRLAALEGKGTITPQQKDALMNDAAPRSLYVSRKLLNAKDVIDWAKGQGFTTTLPADQMHVTILYSKTPVDWMEMGSDWAGDDKGQLRIAPGGPRMLDQFGSLKEATVLLFNSSALCWRHEDMIAKGATSDYAEYCPHVTLTYDAPEGLDLSQVEPYQGELVFGPEVFAEIVDDWASDLTEE